MEDIRLHDVMLKINHLKLPICQHDHLNHQPVIGSLAAIMKAISRGFSFSTSKNFGI